MTSTFSIDINECSDGYHSCEQMCNNTKGSYHCLCFDGYELNGDGYSCKGKYIFKQLLVIHFWGPRVSKHHNCLFNKTLSD